MELTTVASYPSSRNYVPVRNFNELNDNLRDRLRRAVCDGMIDTTLRFTMQQHSPDCYILSCIIISPNILQVAFKFMFNMYLLNIDDGCILVVYADENECSSNPCQNGGTCMDAVNAYSCRCRNGFSGVNCQRCECRVHILHQYFMSAGFSNNRAGVCSLHLSVSACRLTADVYFSLSSHCS